MSVPARHQQAGRPLARFPTGVSDLEIDLDGSRRSGRRKIHGAAVRGRCLDIPRMSEASTGGPEGRRPNCTVAEVAAAAQRNRDFCPTRQPLVSPWLDDQDRALLEDGVAPGAPVQPEAQSGQEQGEGRDQIRIAYRECDSAKLHRVAPRNPGATYSKSPHCCTTSLSPVPALQARAMRTRRLCWSPALRLAVPETGSGSIPILTEIPAHPRGYQLPARPAVVPAGGRCASAVRSLPLGPTRPAAVRIHVRTVAGLLSSRGKAGGTSS